MTGQFPMRPYRCLELRFPEASLFCIEWPSRYLGMFLGLDVLAAASLVFSGLVAVEMPSVC